MPITADQATTMAFLSWTAYDYSYDVVVNSQFINHVQVSAKQNLRDSGWTALGWADLNPTGSSNSLPVNAFDADGFYDDGPAAALVAVKGDTLTVAIRGANEPADFDAALHDQNGYFEGLYRYSKRSSLISPLTRGR
jgi:hypothetical protein